MPERCPTCGLLVVDFDAPPPAEPTCNPIRSPGCWRLVGASRNGGPLLHVIEGGA